MAYNKLYKANGQVLNDNTLVTRKTDEISIGKATGSQCNITAPSVSGYEFVAWVESSTSGWTGATYIQSPNSASTRIWVGASSASSGTGKVTATAIYRPTMTG